MKTLIITCASCLLLAGGYITVKNRDEVKNLLSFSKPESFTFNALPADQQLNANRKPHLDAETSLAPVEILPSLTNALPIVNAVATAAAIPVENKKEVISNTLIDSNWIDYSVFQKEAATTANAFDPATEPDAQPAVTEAESSIIQHVPFIEDDIAEVESALEARRLIMNLNPEKVDSVRAAAPVAVTVPQYAVVTTAAPATMVTTVANHVDDNAKVTYAPSLVVSTQTEAGRDSYSYTFLFDRAERIKAYAARKGYDTSFAFMIDMGMKSGKKRFFVMDLNTMTIVRRGMVAHGRGDSDFTFNKTYSNTTGSNCTSLGIYKVGGQYKGRYGTSFKLTGLESTNSNAAKRSIILHGMNCVPYAETEYPIAQSEGCPSVAPGFLKEISPIISSRSKPILMWIYDPLAESIEENMVANY